MSRVHPYPEVSAMNVPVSDLPLVEEIHAVPLVSVIIPAFNAARFIRETLESLRNQTFQDFEALIVNDGSTDVTADIVEQVCGLDPRFRLISRPHAGLSATRNAGIEEARGEWIAFLDSDDIWFPEKLETQVRVARQRPGIGLVFSNFFNWDGSKDLGVQYATKEMLPDHNSLSTDLMTCNPLNVSTIMVRRDLFEKVGLFDTSFPYVEDRDLWLRMMEHGVTAQGILEPLVRYRSWVGNMSKNRLGMAECRLRVLEKNMQTSRHPEWRGRYEQGVAVARGKLEFLRACYAAEERPREIARHLWSAWKSYPRKTRWLTWCLLAAWPKFLGGKALHLRVQRKLRRKLLHGTE